MPRLPGGPATDLPACPRAGHGAHRVVKDGRYGPPPLLAGKTSRTHWFAGGTTAHCRPADPRAP